MVYAVYKWLGRINPPPRWEEKLLNDQSERRTLLAAGASGTNTIRHTVGGSKMSGCSREQGREAWESHSQYKTVWENLA
jgi:acyl-CoA reductase-like NAD-dependent aldehyde dehydrogenase